MKRAGWIALGVALAIFMAMLVGAAFLVGRAARTVDDVAGRASQIGDEITGVGPYTSVGTVTVQSIRALSELTTVEMVEYTSIEKGDDRGWLNWARGDKITMFAVATVGAGVDLAAMGDSDIRADRETGKVTVILPPAQITYVDPDTEASVVYDRSTGVFTKGNPDLERTARLAAEEVLRQQALDQNILDLAEQRAIKVISDLLTSLGYTDVQVTVSG